MTEHALLAVIVEVCRWQQLLCYHPYDSRRSEPGWPDLVVVGRRVLIREVKSAHGRITADQRIWITRLAAAGMDVDVWRPCDWPARVLAELNGLR